MSMPKWSMIIAVLAVCLTAVGSMAGPPKPGHKVKLPDLAVAKVWVHGNCQLSVLIKNSGKIALSPKQHAAVILRLVLGKEHRDIPLAKIDHRGKLKKPGAKFTFSIALGGLFKKAGSSRLKAGLVFPKKMKEAKHGNNTGSVRLSKRCKARAAASDTPPSGAALPVKIKRVYVKQGTVRVVLVRTKGVKLGATAGSIRLAVKLGKSGGSWRLSKVDPGGRLYRGREVDFNTRLKVSKASSALVSLRCDKWVVRVKVPLTVAAAAGSPATRAPARPRSTPRGPGVLRYLATSIRITSPAAAQVVRGGRIRVTYEPTDDAPLPEAIVVKITRGTQVHTIYDGAAFEGETSELSYPMDLLPPGTGYRVEISSGGVLLAESHVFRLIGLAPAAGAVTDAYGVVRVIAPARGAVWPAGATGRIRWRTGADDRVEGMIWTLELRWPGGSQSMSVRQRAVGYDPASREYYLDYRVGPGHRVGGGFKFVVSAAENPWRAAPLRGESGEFSISASSIALDGGDFIHPDRILVWGNQYRINWRTHGEVRGRAVISLYHGSIRVTELARVNMSDSGYGWTIRYAQLRRQGIHVLTGGGYRIGIESENDPSVKVMSPEFSIIDPYLRITSPEDRETIYYNRTKEITWTPVGVTGTMTLYLIGLREGPQVIAGNVPVASRKYEWRVGVVYRSSSRPGQGSLDPGGVPAIGHDLKIMVLMPSGEPGAPPIRAESGRFSIVRP